MDEIKSLQNYNIGGIVKIWMLDVKHFISYKFKNDRLYDQNFVDGITSSSPFFEITSIDESNFTETRSDRVYKQELNTFVHSLNAEMLSKLVSTSTEKYIVAFRTILGETFIFGSDGGASLLFTQQTGKRGEVSGYSIKITKDSVFPLFQISDIARFTCSYIYKPHFETPFCQLKNSITTGYQIASYVTKETINGQPIDRNGQLCSQSGFKQAIQLLDGTTTANLSEYDIEAYYPYSTSYIKESLILKRNNNLCKAGNRTTINLSESQLFFDDNANTVAVRLICTDNWQLIEEPNIAACNFRQGKAGVYTIIFTKTSIMGIGDFVFLNSNSGETAKINLVNGNNIEWVLKNGNWNNNGYWLKTKTWQ